MGEVAKRGSLLTRLQGSGATVLARTAHPGAASAIRMATEREYERLRALVDKADPLLVRAVDDVDIALLQWGLSLSPWERLRASSGALSFLSTFRRVASEPS